MLILGPDNHKLLPDVFGNKMIDENSSIKRFYPLEFEVDYFGGSYENDYIALIPFIDIEQLQREYESVD